MERFTQNQPENEMPKRHIGLDGYDTASGRVAQYGRWRHAGRHATTKAPDGCYPAVDTSSPALASSIETLV
jgi:hypothetical protein